jgi:hypothetical protein
MAQIGNKKNAVINGEWGRHVRRYGKKRTHGKVRTMLRSFISKIKKKEIE